MIATNSMQSKTDQRFFIYLFLFCLTAYGITGKGFFSASDSVFSLRTAKALLERGSFAIEASEEENSYIFRASPERAYSKYGIGLAFLWLPVVACAKMIAKSIGFADMAVAGFLISFYNTAFGAGSCVLMAKMIRLWGGSHKAALSMALAFGFATLCWRYNVSEHAEATQMFFLFLAVYSVVKHSERSVWWGSFSLGVLILLKLVYVAYLPFVIGYAWVKARPSVHEQIKSIVHIMVFPVLAIVAVMCFNYLRFGNILESGYGKEIFAFYPEQLFRNSLTLLFSLDKGMFVYSPVLLLAMIGYTVLLKTKPHEAGFFICLIALNVSLSAMWHAVGGGWSWGPRFMVPFIPLWIIPLFVFSTGKRKFMNLLLIFVLAGSFVLQLLGILQNDHEYQTIRYAMVPRINGDFAKKMPPNLIGSYILLRHKLREGNNIYPLSEFGLPSQAIVDTTSSENYRGFNVWYVYLAEHFHNRSIKYAPFVMGLLLVVLFFGLWKETLRLTGEVEDSTMPIPA